MSSNAVQCQQKHVDANRGLTGKTLPNDLSCARASEKGRLAVIQALISAPSRATPSGPASPSAAPPPPPAAVGPPSSGTSLQHVSVYSKDRVCRAHQPRRRPRPAPSPHPPTPPGHFRPQCRQHAWWRRAAPGPRRRRPRQAAPSRQGERREGEGRRHRQRRGPRRRRP